MRTKIINAFILGLYIYSCIGIAVLCITAQAYPTVTLILCIIAWASLFSLASLLNKVHTIFNLKVVSIHSKETTEDICLHFHEYMSKTFYAIVEISKGKFVIQPVHLLYVSDVSTINIFYINDDDWVFSETQINMQGHNLWTSQNAARVELCRRNPEVTLEDLNNEQKT